MHDTLREAFSIGCYPAAFNAAGSRSILSFVGRYTIQRTQACQSKTILQGFSALCLTRFIEWVSLTPGKDKT